MKNIAKHAAIVAALNIISDQRNEILERCPGVVWQKIEASLTEIQTMLGEPAEESPAMTQADMQALKDSLNEVQANNAEFVAYAMEHAQDMLDGFADRIAQGVTEKLAGVLPVPATAEQPEPAQVAAQPEQPKIDTTDASAAGV